MADTIDFTIETLEALPKPLKDRVEYKDSKVAGLYLRVSARGVMTFSFIGRAKGSSRTERLTLGKYPAIKPQQARASARQLAGHLASGVSVAAAGRDRRGEMTMEQLFKVYIEYLGNRSKRVDIPQTSWDLYVKPAFGTRKLSEVKARDLERWHRALPEQILRKRAEIAAELAAVREARRNEARASRAARKRGPDPKPKAPVPPAATSTITGRRSADLAMQLVRAMFNWAAAPKQALFVGTNPASKHKGYPDQSRDGFLQPDELRPFFGALAEEPNVTMRDFILLALLTGARRSNVMQAQWSNISLDRSEWRVPGALMKNGKPQTITLSPEAIELLTVRKKDSASPFVFPSERSESGHIEDPREAWKRVRRKAELSDLRIHDLRRTLGSWQARTGASLVLIGKSLNHKDQQSTAIYARLDLDPVRQAVDRATSAMFGAGGIKTPATVVELPKPTGRVSRRGSKAA